MNSPPRNPPNAGQPGFDEMRELIESVSGEVRRAPSGKGVDERPAGGGWGAGPRHEAIPKGDQAQDDFASEVVRSLEEVVAALDSPAMAAFFARAYAQGNSYTGPTLNMDRLRSLIAKAEARGYSRKRAAVIEDTSSRSRTTRAADERASSPVRALTPTMSRPEPRANFQVEHRPTHPGKEAPPAEVDEAKSAPKLASG
jgi:hypothetical protein